MYDSDSIMRCSTPIPSVANILKNIFLGGPLWDLSISEYYYDQNNAFGLLFQQYTASALNNTYNPSIVHEWKYNTDKADYEDMNDLGVYIPSVKKNQLEA